MITVNELKNKYVNKMIESGIESAAFDFSYVLREVADIDAGMILSCPEMKLDSDLEARLSQIFDRYILGEPLQYILGYTWFMDNKFKVAPGVLIPRWDTEVVCEKAIEYLKYIDSPLVLDMCCGSGCIGLSIADSITSSKVYLCDISPTAIDIASENSLNLGLNNSVKVCSGDLFEALKKEKIDSGFNMIISNPPYISREIVETLDSRVKDHEPLSALDGGEDGLDFYKRIIEDSPLYLLPGGMLMFETGYDQTDAVAKLIETKGCYENIVIFKDYGGNPRGVSGLMK